MTREKWKALDAREQARRDAAWTRAQELERAGRFEEAEETLRTAIDSIGAIHQIAYLYELRMVRLLQEGDEAGARDACQRSCDAAWFMASCATSGGEGAALSLERDLHIARVRGMLGVSGGASSDSAAAGEGDVETPVDVWALVASVIEAVKSAVKVIVKEWPDAPVGYAMAMQEAVKVVERAAKSHRLDGAVPREVARVVAIVEQFPAGSGNGPRSARPHKAAEAVFWLVEAAKEADRATRGDEAAKRACQRAIAKAGSAAGFAGGLGCE